MGSMHTRLEEERGGFEKLAAYFAARARGSVGLIVTGGVAPSREVGSSHSPPSSPTNEKQDNMWLLPMLFMKLAAKSFYQILHWTLWIPSTQRGPVRHQSAHRLV